MGVGSNLVYMVGNFTGILTSSLAFFRFLFGCEQAPVSLLSSFVLVLTSSVQSGILARPIFISNYLRRFL